MTARAKRVRRVIDAVKPSLNGKHEAPKSPKQRSADDASVELLIESFATMKARPVRWLVPERIPLGKVTLIGGRGGDGKSTAMRHLAARIVTDRPAFGLVYDPPVSGRVLIIAAEDDPADTILPHLLAEDADVSKIDILKGVKIGDSETGFCLGIGHVEALRAKLLADPSIRLIIIDPIASYVGRTKGIDDHRASELRLILDPLNQLANDTGVAIILIAHLNKSSGAAVDRVAGSAAYRDAVRCAYLVCPDPDDDGRRFLMPIKENLPGFDRTAIPFALESLTPIQADMVMDAPQFKGLTADERELMAGQLRRVRFDAAQAVNPDEVMTPKREDKNKVQRCVDWLSNYLKDFAAPADKIEEAAAGEGFTKDNVFRAKAKLKQTANLHNSNRGRFQGKWWSGFGHPDTWKTRPDTPEIPESPDFPDIE